MLTTIKVDSSLLKGRPVQLKEFIDLSKDYWTGALREREG
jgi:hypothetical protein